ncbi:MAG: amidohydrolase family protein [Chloroflexota bacterium]
MAIDPRVDAYILTGRVVTMGSRGVLDDGQICLLGREIKAVLAAGEPVPPDLAATFAGAPTVATGGTIYPGLIELHNHLSYNAMPLWDVPATYSNNGQWRGGDDYSRKITKPSQVLGQSPGVLEALVRYVECRAMLGGVTTTQGITLANASTLTRHYKGLVRNVEAPGDPDLPLANTNIANPNVGGAEAYLTKLKAQRGAYLQHLSEGTDDTARGWFLRLQRSDNSFAVTRALSGIHCAALRADDFAVLAGAGASMIWSPLSNFLLYGKTADIAAAKASNVLMGLGSDWAPSGTKNLLGELKVAWLTSQATPDAHGDPTFSPHELVAMATINPARILRWDQRLGSIEAGKLADFVVVTGTAGDPYLALVEATERSLRLVVIDGVPRLGTPALMHRFGPGTEEITVGGAKRVLDLHDPAGDPLVEATTLTGATAALADGMARLPELAAAVDAASASGAFAGAADAAGGVWRVVPDFEADDFAMGYVSAAQPYAYWVSAMTLDPITVVDDPKHLPTLVGARNLPVFVKAGLPPLYGQHIPLPQGATFLSTPAAPVVPELIATTRELTELAEAPAQLSLEGRRLIVDQALVLLQENYVHLPLKRAMHAVDPVQQLRLLQHRLDEQTDATMGPEADFHADVLAAFNSLRDLHTNYRLSTPFNSRVAWLPFLVEECYDGVPPTRRYLVTKVVADAGPADFVPGVEITHWNGASMEQAVARNAERQAGSNPDARHARGLNSLTIRPLAGSLPPDEAWVTVTYVGADGGPASEYRQPWLTFQPGQAARVNPGDLVAESAAIGVDDRTDDIGHVRKLLFAPAVARAEEVAGRQLIAAMAVGGNDVIETRLPGVLKARSVTSSAVGAAATPYGYLRIYSFNVGDADAFVAEVARLLELLPPDGLIIDVRGNGGGLIYAAERTLQLLSPRVIEPQRAQFITTPLNLAICRNHATDASVPGLALGAWVPSMRLAVETGATYSNGFPITPPDACNTTGQRYFGPVVLITDPLCYSATDMFAAGFQDHDIGPVIGVGGATGAGGANVWTHALLRALLAPADLADPGPSPYRGLPAGADMRVAARRTTRVRGRQGDILEDLGVTPDLRYLMTRRDVLEENRDLIDTAINRLASAPSYGLSLQVAVRRGRWPRVTVEARNIDRIDARVWPAAEAALEGRWLATRAVAGGRVELDPEDVLPKGGTSCVLEVLGIASGVVVARRRQALALG